MASERRLVFRGHLAPEYPEDVERIIAVFADRGFTVAPCDAVAAWEAFSERMCAGWMMLPGDDNEVWRSAIPFLAEAPDAN